MVGEDVKKFIAGGVPRLFVDSPAPDTFSSAAKEGVSWRGKKLAEQFDISNPEKITENAINYSPMGVAKKTGLDIAKKASAPIFKGLKDLSTKLLEKFKGMPVEAFGHAPLKTILGGAAATAGIGSLFVPSEPTNVYTKPKPVIPKVVESLTDIHGPYMKLDTGTTLRPVADKFRSAIQQAYQSSPSIEKGVIEALLMKESMMGKNPANKNPDIGKYAWLVGITPIGKKELIRNGIVPDLDTPEGAIKAAAQYWDLQDDKHATSTEAYNSWYSSGKLKPEQLQEFSDMVNYYGNNR